MKLNLEKLGKLAIFSKQQLVLLGGLTPQLITGMLAQDKSKPDNGLADVEFGWSGLQLCSSNLSAYETLSKKEGNSGFLLEGAGYLSIGKELIDEFEEGKKFPWFDAEDMGRITQLVCDLVSSDMMPDTEGTMCIVQLGENHIELPNSHFGVSVHVMLPVSEDAWTNLYQVHAMEMQAATEWYKEAKKNSAPGMLEKNDLSSHRSLN